MKMDIRNLRLPVSLGVHAWEQNSPREVVIQLQLEINNTQATKIDDITHTVDYTAIEECLHTLFSSQHWNLLETLAEDATKHLMHMFPLLCSIAITIDKPGALRFAESVAVTVETSR